ncbi:MAG: glycosyltransferase family protein [Acidiferrobacterales bacterium]
MSHLRVMCHVQHLMGSGHQWRVAAITRALCQLGADVAYVSGGFPVPGLDVGCARFVQLPPARSPDMQYKTLVNDSGLPVDDKWKAQRRDLLLDVFRQYQPDVLFVEAFPFGRRLLRFELLPLLEAAQARRPSPSVVCSVRDILEQRNRPGRNEEIVRLVDHYFDLVLVHSDPKLIPFESTFPLAERIRNKLQYTGYVLSRDPIFGDSKAGAGEVVVSAGGGAFGEHVLRAALAARPLSALADATWHVLVGPNLPEHRFIDLRSQTEDGLIIERNRSDFPVLLRNCAVSISQAGYNTILEVLQAGTRAVLVPYTDEREKEQAVRARQLRDRGLVETIENSELTPQRLAQAVDAVYRRPLPNRKSINLDGAASSADVIASMTSNKYVAQRL